jgi:membrane-associated protein
LTIYLAEAKAFDAPGATITTVEFFNPACACTEQTIQPDQPPNPSDAMTLPELLSLIQRYDDWVYGFLLAYCLGKTGPLPMLAGFAAAQGALRLDSLLVVTLLGSIAGAQIRFAVGWFASPWVYRSMPTIAPWVALASAGVERYSLRVLLVYRFVKGTFSLVGLGAGASLLAWPKFASIDSLGAMLWISAMVGIGWTFGQLGAALDPRWAAYVGLTLLVTSIVAFSLLGSKIKARLLPLAEKILQERAAKKSQAA